MSPETELGRKSDDWLNEMIRKMRYGQDYSLCWGHSKPMLDDEGNEKGINIRRPYIRLFSTGIQKMYEMQVLGKDIPDTEYTEAEMKKMDAEAEAAEKKCAGKGWS